MTTGKQIEVDLSLRSGGKRMVFEGELEPQPVVSVPVEAEDEPF